MRKWKEVDRLFLWLWYESTYNCRYVKGFKNKLIVFVLDCFLYFEFWYEYHFFESKFEDKEFNYFKWIKNILEKGFKKYPYPV